MKPSAPSHPAAPSPVTKNSQILSFWSTLSGLLEAWVLPAPLGTGDYLYVLVVLTLPATLPVEL